jgi:lipopolysaccharide/colanic/teichoic acid biosynthesis glycosyltransferase
MIKRGFDLLAACLGMLMLAPLWVLIALAIKRDSPGPVFFRQTRVGRHGKLFRIHKFRTMHHSSTIEQQALQITPHDDPRLTSVGRWLRETKLDELPQLINVFWGDMSLVGPRPEVSRYVALYPPHLRDKILSVRPGITDPASLAYRNEGHQLSQTHDPEHDYIHNLMPAKLAQSAHYIDHASLWHDLRLIASTLRDLVMR